MLISFTGPLASSKLLSSVCLIESTVIKQCTTVSPRWNSKKKKKSCRFYLKETRSINLTKLHFTFLIFAWNQYKRVCVSNHCIYIATDALWAAKSLVADLHRTQWKTENMLQCNWLDKSVQNSLFWLLTINVGIHRKERKRQWWYN